MKQYYRIRQYIALLMAAALLFNSGFGILPIRAEEAGTGNGETVQSGTAATPASAEIPVTENTAVTTPPPAAPAVIRDDDGVLLDGPVAAAARDLVFDPLVIEDITELYRDYTEYLDGNQEDLTELLTGDIKDQDGKPVEGITLDIAGLGAFFSAPDRLTAQKKQLAAAGYRRAAEEAASFADLVRQYRLQLDAKADDTDEAVRQKLYRSFFGAYVGNGTDPASIDVELTKNWTALTEATAPDAAEPAPVPPEPIVQEASASDAAPRLSAFPAFRALAVPAVTDTGTAEAGPADPAADTTVKVRTLSFGLAGATPPNAVALLTVNCAGLDQLPQDNGVVLYGIVKDTPQTFNVGVPKNLFGSGDLTMTVSLAGVYGMAFTDNLVPDLKEKSQIKDAWYTKDSNGNNTGLTIVIDGTLTENYLMALGTKYTVLTNAQCADIIANGYQDATVTFEVKNQAGELVAANDHYKLRPGTYTGADIKIDEHKWMIGTDAAYLNWSVLSDSNPLYGQTLQATDAFRMTVPVASVNGNRLMQLGQIRVYSPGEEFELARVGNSPQYSGWGPITGPSITGDYYFLNYYKPSDNYAPHDDGDGKGTYYLFEPRKVMYNNGTAVLTEAQSYYAYFTWKVKTGIDYLEGSHTYAAENEIISCTAEAGDSVRVDTNPGMVYTTLPVVKRDSLVFYPNGNYQKYTDKNGIVTAKEQYVPGASYTGKRLMTIGNRGGYGDAVLDGTKQRVEYQTIKGNITESYTFPYEIQPTQLTFSRTSETITVVGTVSYTITRKDGTTVIKTVEYHKPEPLIGPLSFAEDLAAAGEGARISNVTILWDQLKGSGAYPVFDYTITKTHADGSPLGGLLQIAYQAVCSDDGKSFDTAVNQPRYFYLSMGEQKCPWLIADGSSYQRYYPKDLDNSEVSLGATLYLKGLSGGSYRNYLENPVIRLDVELAMVDGMDDPTCMLSGDMTLTRNMSGWKFSYTLYDTATGLTRDAEYTVPQLTGDTPLTRADLGLADTEFFTDLKMSYDGTFTFLETTQAKQEGGTGDGAVAGTYDITMLLRNIKAYTRPTALKTDTRLSTPLGRLDTYCTRPTMRFVAALSHSGTCDRKAHTDGGEAAMNPSVWNYPWYLVFANYSYTAIGPNFSYKDVTAKVTQGSTATAVIDFALASKANEGYSNLSPRYQSMPWDTAEAIYIELTDDQFDVDTSNAQFQASLAAHGMTAQDVTVVTAGGKRWLRLATPGKCTETSKTASSTGTRHDNTFTIALRAWTGATVSVHKPFGEVYYDVSGLLKKYDGSAAAGYVTENFEGAVPDVYGLLGDGDTTTARLWMGSMGASTVEVLRNTVTGVTLLPGKNGIIDQSGVTTFEPDESQSLLASTTINAPETELYNYTTVTYIPRKGDITKYTQMVDGQQVNGEKTCEFTLYLEGPAYTNRSSAENPTTVTYSYSKNGTDWVPEAAVGGDEWHDYRYIKTVVDIIAPYKSVETRYPLTSGFKTMVGDFHDYVGGTWSFQDGLGDTARVTSGKMMYGEFIQTDFTLRGPAGSFWWDAGEDGFNNNGEQAAADIALKLYSPDTEVTGYDGRTIPARTLIDATVTGEDGSYLLRSYIAYADQIVEVTMPDGTTKITRQTSPSETVKITDRWDDSDFDRSLNRQKMPAFPKTGIKNVSCGLIHQPKLTVNDVKLHIGALKTAANACGAVCTSENPAHASPEIVFATASDAAGVALVDETGAVTALKTGVQPMTASASDTLAEEEDQRIPEDTVTAGYNIIVYTNVHYDAGTGSGTVPVDSGEYYPSGDETTDTVTVLPGTGLSRSGYYLVGWSEDPDADCNDESKFIRAGSTFRTGDRTDDVTLYAVWKICDPVKSGSPAEKKLNVTNLKPETDEIFRFALRAVSTDVEGLTKETMPLPEDGENRPIEGITITGAGTADFGDITFVVPGVYRYEVTETDEGADGYTYDSTVCTITYTVTQPDAAATALQCVRTIAGADGKTEETAAFTNIYTCEPTADSPSVEKKLEITDLNPEHDATFTFLLVPESTTAAGLTRETMPLPDGAENGVREATVTGTGTADFGSIPFTRTGIYVYSVTEKNSGDAGYVYDDRVYTLTYEVIRTGTRLVCTRTIADSSTQAEAEGCIFTNTYTCRETADGLPLEKKISITDSEPEDTDFTFVLAPVSTTAEGIRTEDMPMPLDPDGKTVSEVVITGAGTAEFGTITFRHTGSYVYRLSERNDQAPGFTYDSTVYTVTYEVRQDGKNLVSVRTIRNQKREEAEKGLFVNSYDIASATDDPPVEKQVTVTDRQPATGEKFDFVLTPATCSVAEMTTADMPMPDGSTDQKKTVSVVGAGSAEFGRLAFRRAGTYVYTISEVGGTAEGYTYDTAVYTVTYEVSREGDRLVSRRTITGADGSAADRPVFTNVYTRHASDHGGSSGGGGVTPKHAVPTETTVIVATTEAEPATEEQAPEIGVLPKTGDGLPLILLLCLLLCSGTGLLFLAAGKRRAGGKRK